MEINLLLLLLNLSCSLDFSFQGLMRHHHRVALMALHLGEAAGLRGTALFNLFKAAIIHDAGAIKWSEKETLLHFDMIDTWEHCLRGYRFVESSILSPVADIILSHHDRWEGGNRTGLCKGAIPLASRIIHLVDRVDVLIDNGINIFEQRSSILARIQEFSGTLFDPDLVCLLNTLARKESFWLDLALLRISPTLIPDYPDQRIYIGADELLSMAVLFARIIDAKSPFTYRHSFGVGTVTGILAEEMGLPKEEVVLLKTAGYLHDLGKLSVPDDILEKPNPLSEAEFNIIKQHPYYTYYLLQPVLPDVPLAEWAAYHHERLDGSGYPFHKTGANLDIGSRIVAVADIYSALREERPYRTSLSGAEALRLICRQVDAGMLDRAVVSTLVSRQKGIDDAWDALSNRFSSEMGIELIP